MCDHNMSTMQRELFFPLAIFYVVVSSITKGRMGIGEEEELGTGKGLMTTEVHLAHFCLIQVDDNILH